MKSKQNTLTLWIVIFLLLALAVRVFTEGKKDYKQISYSEFITLVEQSKVKEVTFKGDKTILGQFVEGYDNMVRFKVTGDTGETSFNLLRKNGITPNYEEEEKQPFYASLLLTWGPMILIIVIFYFFLRQIQMGGGKAMSFGKSRAKMLNASEQKFTFSDVAGVDEAKEELKEVVDFLKEPKKYTALGGKIPKGVILVGPPGTGKTLLARAVAGEAGVPFFSISGSDFVEMFVGVGASRVRDLFEQGKKNAPCIIFVDEIDAVGRHRGSGLGGGHDEREQTLNQLLVEMDGFESNEGVILIAATNRMDVLDPALLRPGRFDRRVTVGLPDVRGRLGILKVHTKKTPLEVNVNLENIAKGTPGFTGADLANLVNEAALQAARMSKKHLEDDDFEFAKDKVLMGPERKSMIISDKEKRVTAYHEAGHVLVGMNLPQADPIHKVSIVPRGHALGVTQFLPDEEMHNLTREKANNFIASLMGGRSAEEIVLGEITNGASNDIERATLLARTMVCQWGMSERLGPINFKKSAFSPFAQGEQLDYSEKMANQIDEEVFKIVDENHKLARKILTDHKTALEKIATALIVWETLDYEQIKALVRGEDIGVPTFNKVEDMSNQPVQTDESLKNTKETVRNKVPDILPTT
ncbi:MAG: cell division protein FtsH [Bdellovibrionales bacterium RIFOXYB1_FULL_37_110]|nr:MAG: cell division protein FtsH [Bdellovibrionales bacterium RIFOXYC1_FULL_37_79]OFZ57448.1 MAG: cell division protein FtsH [Bdellovibrionales bacterium RIFOXYB1_FULL_37_110]OFZ63403.1 MAG: cell division protein FtsH [Bdellovibrionales bacterium RIFOXYB2_FULL_36_6]OFZ64540.1 MAG: cell division protein FtsH [Bdellovibrionales bacterium RIFOXYD1_FULL_36_51]